LRNALHQRNGRRGELVGSVVDGCQGVREVVRDCATGRIGIRQRRTKECSIEVLIEPRIALGFGRRRKGHAVDGPRSQRHLVAQVLADPGLERFTRGIAHVDRVLDLLDFRDEHRIADFVDGEQERLLVQGFLVAFHHVRAGDTGIRQLTDEVVGEPVPASPVA
jgi:hypothetical protein